MDGSAAKATSRGWPEEGPSRVPSWVYSDPDIFVREQERIFGGRGWSYLCLEAELPQQGDFKRSQIGTKSVVAVRGEGGEIAAFVNRCAHRGVQLCREAQGRAKEF